jgi:N-acetylglucosamine-6-phosphate deacetylase
MPPIHHRAPGLLGAAIDDPRVTLEAIPDGVHLHPSVLSLLLRAAPGRVALVTDAIAAAGLGDGTTSLGGLPVEVRDGVATLADGTIAGSSITLSEGVRRAVAAGIPFRDAVIAATATPARALGLPRTGTLEPGSRGDLVLWDASLGVRAVWQDGRRLEAS